MLLLLSPPRQRVKLYRQAHSVQTNCAPHFPQNIARKLGNVDIILPSASATTGLSSGVPCGRGELQTGQIGLPRMVWAAGTALGNNTLRNLRLSIPPFYTIDTSAQMA